MAGVSVMRLDAGMDTGPVFSQAQIPVLSHDTAGSLTSRLFAVGARLLLEVLAFLPAGNAIPEPQMAAEASYSREITREDGRIDWRFKTLDIWRRIRAYQPWPGAYTTCGGRQLKIIEAVPLAGQEKREPGCVVPVAPDAGAPEAAFGVSTGDGVLGVIKVQIEGKRAMPAAEFLRGQRDFASSMLG
jgi:methionyl-tRNA formyltransferase